MIRRFSKQDDPHFCLICDCGTRIIGHYFGPQDGKTIVHCPWCSSRVKITDEMLDDLFEDYEASVEGIY